MLELAKTVRRFGLSYLLRLLKGYRTGGDEIFRGYLEAPTSISPTLSSACIGTCGTMHNSGDLAITEAFKFTQHDDLTIGPRKPFERGAHSIALGTIRARTDEKSWRLLYTKPC